jgi:hypothetical protein
MLGTNFPKMRPGLGPSVQNARVVTLIRWSADRTDGLIDFCEGKLTILELGIMQ